MKMAKENENCNRHDQWCIHWTQQSDQIYAISEIIVVFTAELYSKSIYQRHTKDWDKHIESLWFQGILHEVWPYMVKTGNRSQLQWQLFMQLLLDLPSNLKIWATQCTKRLYSHPQTCLISINCCDNVRPNQRGMPNKHFGKTAELKRGDTKTMVWGNLTALLWNDKTNVKTLTKKHHLPAAGDLHVDMLWNQSYCNRHVGYVDALWFPYNPAFESVFLDQFTGVMKHKISDPGQCCTQLPLISSEGKVSSSVFNVHISILTGYTMLTDLYVFWEDQERVIYSLAEYLPHQYCDWTTPLWCR